jgi:hypothetical protein
MISENDLRERSPGLEKCVRRMSDEQRREIEILAYLIWEREGRPHGQAHAHWERALREWDAGKAKGEEAAPMEMPVPPLRDKIEKRTKDERLPPSKRPRRAKAGDVTAKGKQR